MSFLSYNKDVTNNQGITMKYSRTLPILYIFLKNGERMFKDLSHLSLSDRTWCLDFWKNHPDVSLTFLTTHIKYHHKLESEIA